MYINRVACEVHERRMETGGKWFVGSRVWCLCQVLLADETTPLAESAELLQCLLREFERVCKTEKLRIDMVKKHFS